MDKREGKKLIRQVAPIAALVVFVIVIVILCVVVVNRNQEADTSEETVQQEEADASGQTDAAETVAEDSDEAGAGEETEEAGGTAEEDADGEAEEEAEAEEEEEEDEDTAGTADEVLTVETEEIQETMEAEVEAELNEDGTVTDVEEDEPIIKTNEEMLTEMMAYWSRGNIEAVEDLARLSHYMEMSATLESSVYFYYYGDRNADGKPEGTGIAVYGENEYYYGEWVDGARSGDGMWLKMYLDEEDEDYDPGILYHSYDGAWANNLPYGEGQEQYGLDRDELTEGIEYLQNVIGNFTAGLYDGEMYLLTMESSGNVREWKGTADYGVFETYDGRDSEGKVPICEDVKDEDGHLWISALDNLNLGVKELVESAG